MNGRYKHHTPLLYDNEQIIFFLLFSGLAKISTHSTSWQFKTIKLVQRVIKSRLFTVPYFPCDRRDRARRTINGGHLDFQLY